MPARGSGKPISVLTSAQQRQFEHLIEDPKFKECLNRLTGWRARRASQGQSHPFLSKEDLKAVALSEAFITFSKYVNRPVQGPDGMRRLVVQAMKWKILKEYKRAQRQGGEDGTVIVSLNEYLDTEADMSGSINPIMLTVAEGGGEADGFSARLQAEVADVAGDPDPLTMLLIKERVSNIGEGVV